MKLIFAPKVQGVTKLSNLMPTNLSSKEASSFYMDNRIATFKECTNPCTKMNIVTNLKFRKKDSANGKRVNAIFARQVQVNEETQSKSIISLGGT